MTQADLAEELTSYHDNLVYALHLRAPDPESGDWASELILDIDHITEWLCGTDGRTRFRVAPATLTFQDVTDLAIRFDYRRDGFPALSLNEASIDTIEREPIRREGAARDVPYWRWRIAFNLPPGGEVAFGAGGSTLALRAAPLLCDEQRLPRRGRPNLLVSR
jgi:hypothetical protein